MKLELRKNMYIRTNEGIRKILNEFEEDYELNRCLHYCYPEGHDLYKEDLEDDEDKILKEPSFNVIDILEEGDYVNGRKVYQVGYNFQDDFVLKMSKSNYDDFIYPNEIETIVTHEQFEQMAYKVGE